MAKKLYPYKLNVSKSLFHEIRKYPIHITAQKWEHEPIIKKIGQRKKKEKEKKEKEDDGLL